jgi:hypothetical protein
MVLYIEYRHCSWNVVQVKVVLRVAYIDTEKKWKADRIGT